MDSRLITGPSGSGPPSPVETGGRRRYRHARSPHPSRWRRWVAVAGVVCIAGGVVLGFRIFAFYHHSDQVGSSLIHQEERARSAAVAAAGRGAACTAGFPAASAGDGSGTGGASPVTVAGAGLSATATASGDTGAGAPKVDALLRAPAIGLVAPVVDGIGADQLDVAVGHVPASSWPAGSGTTVLAAHDVTWFSRIGQLQPGDRLSVTGPCTTYTYQVTDHRIVSSTTPVYQSNTPELVLVTCYPLDALFLTSQRYLVDARLVQVAHVRAAPTTPTSPTTPVAAATPTVPAPAPLAAQGLDTDNNPAPLGSLAVTGTPAAGWAQSNQPLDDEQAVLELYFAALRSAGQNQPTWWTAVAPTVPFSAASHLVGARVTRNDATFSPTLSVTGDTLTGAQLTTEPVLADNDEPGTYRISMTATVTGGKLEVTGWTMTEV